MNDLIVISNNAEQGPLKNVQGKPRRKVRIDRSEGNDAAFDLVLIDGHEDAHYPTNMQIEDSSDQISLAMDLGCPFEDENDQPMPHEEGRHGIAYDFLKDHALARTLFDEPQGHFDGTPDLEFVECEHCSCFHRMGYGGDCTVNSERYLNTDDGTNVFVPSTTENCERLGVTF